MKIKGLVMTFLVVAGVMAVVFRVPKVRQIVTGA